MTGFLSFAQTAGYPTVLAIYSIPLPSHSSLSDNANHPVAISPTETATSRPFERCRLHTVLLFTPDAAANEGPGPGGYTGHIRDLAWQPAPSAETTDEELDYGEETFVSDEEARADTSDEMLVVVTGQKGFATWRAPRSSSRDGVPDTGLAECVGIPARGCPFFDALPWSVSVHVTDLSRPHAETDFAASSLSFAPASRKISSSPVVISSGPSSASTTNSEGTFCVAYPVPASATEEL